VTGLLMAGATGALIGAATAGILQGVTAVAGGLLGSGAEAGASSMAQSATTEAADQTSESAAETAGQDAARSGEDDPNCGGQSFTGKTKVLLADGKERSISTLKTGQKVLATDTRTGKNKAETITAVLVHDDHDLYDLKVRADGRTAVIDTTSNHLFWDETSRRRIKAAALKYGTHLRTPSGGQAVALGGHTPSNPSGWMWDLTVPGNNDHDFYVTAGATTVLVHNIDEEQCPLFDDGPYRSASAAPVRATLNIGNDSFAGTSLARGNPAIKGTFSFFVEHAEGDAFSQAVNSGADYSGESGTLSVTQGPCNFCVSSISAVARSMGLRYLRIETPEGLFGEYTPETGLTRRP
jgi:hypothetical protein